MDDEKVLYGLDDDILFRKCSLYNGSSVNFGDCTNFSTKEVNWVDHHFCNQEGIHFHCAKHPEFELEFLDKGYGAFLTCPKCKNEIDIGSYHQLRSRCLRALNREIFKDAQLIRVNDWYIPEVKKVKVKPTSDYRVITDVKTDKDGDTIALRIARLSMEYSPERSASATSSGLFSERKPTRPRLTPRIGISLSITSLEE